MSKQQNIITIFLVGKEKTINFVSSVIIFFILLFFYSKFGPALPISVTTQEKGEPIVVSGQGKVSVVPDIANISLGIEETGISLKSTQNTVNEKSQRLTKELKKLGVSEKDIKTTSYNVYPEYDYESRPYKITGYRVSIDYSIKVYDFDKVNEILVAVTDVGVNSVNGVSFMLSDELKKEKVNEARKIAADEAKSKAQGLAQAANITLGKIINISEGTPSIPLREYALPVSGGGDLKENIEPDIQPGETDINVTVSLSYEIR